MRKHQAFSLVEVLIVVAVIGVISAVALPAVSRIREASNQSKNLANAKTIEQMSRVLAGLGVAHVIPDSLGGVEATARLLREGVIVPEGPMGGETFSLPGLADEDIQELSKLLRIEYDLRELRLAFRGTESNSSYYSPFRDPSLIFAYLISAIFWERCFPRSVLQGFD